MASTRPSCRERTSRPRNASKRLETEKETTHDLRSRRRHASAPRHRRDTSHSPAQAEEDKKAGRKPTRVKRDRSANNLTIISDDGWETVPTTTASVRRSSSRKERSQSPANVPTDVNMGGFGALLGGDKKKKDKDGGHKSAQLDIGGLGDELEDIDDALVDAEVVKAYDNQSQNLS